MIGEDENHVTRNWSSSIILIRSGNFHDQTTLERTTTTKGWWKTLFWSVVSGGFRLFSCRHLSPSTRKMFRNKHYVIAMALQILFLLQLDFFSTKNPEHEECWACGMTNKMVIDVVFIFHFWCRWKRSFSISFSKKFFESFQNIKNGWSDLIKKIPSWMNKITKIEHCQNSCLLVVRGYNMITWLWKEGSSRSVCWCCRRWTACSFLIMIEEFVYSTRRSPLQVFYEPNALIPLG